MSVDFRTLQRGDQLILPLKEVIAHITFKNLATPARLNNRRASYTKPLTVGRVLECRAEEDPDDVWWVVDLSDEDRRELDVFLEGDEWKVVFCTPILAHHLREDGSQINYGSEDLHFIWSGRTNVKELTDPESPERVVHYRDYGDQPPESEREGRHRLYICDEEDGTSEILVGSFITAADVKRYVPSE